MESVSFSGLHRASAAEPAVVFQPFSVGVCRNMKQFSGKLFHKSPALSNLHADTNYLWRHLMKPTPHASQLERRLLRTAECPNRPLGKTAAGRHCYNSFR